MPCLYSPVSQTIRESDRNGPHPSGYRDKRMAYLLFQRIKNEALNDVFDHVGMVASVEAVAVT